MRFVPTSSLRLGSSGSFCLAWSPLGCPVGLDGITPSVPTNAMAPAPVGVWVEGGGRGIADLRSEVKSMEPAAVAPVAQIRGRAGHRNGAHAK